MNISRFFIDRPIFAGVLSMIIFLAGLISIFNLPVSEYPDVVPPSVVVRAIYPGANPKVIAETVAAPIEEQINGVEHMLYMESQATTDGVLQLTVTFRIGTDVDQAETQVQNRVQRALPRLPEEVRQIGVITQKSSPDFAMVVHILSPDESYDELYLRNYAVLNIKDNLQRIPGMGQVLVFGAGDYAMRVWLDPQKLASRNLTASDIVRALREQNKQVAAGVVGAPPSPRNTDFQLSVNAQGRLVTEHEFGEVIIATSPDGGVLRLKDVARIELGAGEYALRSLLNNKPAVALGIFQAPGSNAIQLSNNVRRAMAEMKRDFPPGVDYDIVYDPTRFVQKSINAVIETLIEAILLVVIVVIVFLQTWRASIIPLVAVPVSIVGTFAFMLLFGFSINTLTLFGLVLAIGIVVDDAIVVVENVERNIELGQRLQDRDLPRDARSERADHRDHADAVRGVRADRLRLRPHRPVLPAVRSDHRDLDSDLGVQFAHAFAGTRRAAAQAARRAQGLARRAPWTAHSARSSAGSTAHSSRARASTRERSRACSSTRRSRSSSISC